MYMRRQDKPDFVEGGLLAVLTVWIVSVLYLINQASTAVSMSELSWISLTTFFTAFSSVVLLVVAILLARMIRRLR